MKFKNWIFPLCLAFLLAFPAISFGDAPVAKLFADGNALYAKGKYQEAIKNYQQIVDEGYRSASVYFNLGDAYYKNGNIPSAILYFEKAHKLAPGDDDINFNLKFANLRTTDKVEQVPEFFLSRWWTSLVLNFSIGSLAVWSIILVLAGSVLLILYFFAAGFNTKRYSFYGSVGLFILGLFSVFIANTQQSYFDNNREAIVFTPAVNVKSSPAEKSGTLFIIHQGTKVEVLDNDNGWTKVGLANGNEGWLKASDLKTI